MINTSGLHPCGHRVLVKPREVEETTESGIVLARDYHAKEQMAQVYATVIEVGSGAWLDTVSKNWAKEGDTVAIGKYSGLIFDGADGEKYRIINDLDVVATVDE